MAYSPIAFTAANYRDYKFNWLKAYEPGTTTPKVMATDLTLGTLIAKAEINIDGFIISAGGALITPYIDNSYDLWLFPTEALADANDTNSALRLADNITGAASAGEAGGPILQFDQVISESFTVSAGSNALSISPTIANGAVVTVPVNSVYVIL